ncbi:hypothetical protein MHYP_G00113320 [Metynnis hypsauchen]
MFVMMLFWLLQEDPGAELDLEPSTQQAQETLAEQAIEPTSTTTVPKGVKMVKRKKWETSEVKAVEKHLNRFIKTCTVPGKKDCEACIKAEPLAFKDRDWLSVKFFVKNRITALKRKISTVAEDLLSSPVRAVQNNRLPLIHTDSTEQDYSTSSPRHTQQLRGRIMRGGVAGTMHAVSSLPPLREPTLLLESLSRPNTTHTFRSDTPLKSSFTPMDFACNVRMGRGLLAGDFSRTGHGTPMGVTGFSITCSTASGFSECTTPLKKRPHLLSSTDGEGRNTPLLGSIGTRKALSRFPVPARKKFQVVLS